MQAPTPSPCRDCAPLLVHMFGFFSFSSSLFGWRALLICAVVLTLRRTHLFFSSFLALSLCFRSHTRACPPTPPGKKEKEARIKTRCATTKHTKTRAEVYTCTHISVHMHRL